SSEQCENIVISRRDGPKDSRKHAGDFLEIPKEPLKQVQHMNSLVKKLTTSGECRLGAPFRLVTYPTAVAVVATNKQGPANSLLLKKLVGTANRRMVAMIVATLQ